MSPSRRRSTLLAAALLAAGGAVVSAAPVAVAAGKGAQQPRAGAAATAAAPAAAPSPTAMPFRKRPLPDLELVTLEGQRVRTRELRGKVVLLDFWGTWCAPCRAAVPDLRDLNERLAKKPFAMVSIANDLDRSTVERFVADEDMEWIQVWDGEQAIIRKLDVRSYPTYVLVDHEGNVVFAAAGWGPNVEREIETRVGKAVAAAAAAAGS